MAPCEGLEDGLRPQVECGWGDVEEGVEEEAEEGVEGKDGQASCGGEACWERREAQEEDEPLDQQWGEHDPQAKQQALEAQEEACVSQEEAPEARREEVRESHCLVVYALNSHIGLKNQK